MNSSCEAEPKTIYWPLRSVLEESIEPRHNASTGETWLHGCFTYMLYGDPIDEQC